MPRMSLLAPLFPSQARVMRLNRLSRPLSSDRDPHKFPWAPRQRQRRTSDGQPKQSFRQTERYEKFRQVMQHSKKHSEKIRRQAQPRSPLERVLTATDADSAEYQSLHQHPETQRGKSSATKKDDIPPIMLSSYSDVMKYVVGRTEFRRGHTSKPIPPEIADPVQDYLLREEAAGMDISLSALDDALRNTNHEHPSESQDLRERLNRELREQQKRFVETMGWTKEHYSMMKGGLRFAAGVCARNALGPPVEWMWLKGKEAGIAEKDYLQTLLHVAATYLPGNRRKRALYGKYSGSAVMSILGDESSNEGAPEEDDLIDIVDEIAVCHDLKHQPTEQSLMVRSRLLIAQGNGQEAEYLLNRYSNKTTLHLRSFLPILRLYLDQGDIGPALRVYRKMRELSPVILDADTYVHLIASLAEQGIFHPASPPIENVAGSGFKSTSGPCLLNELLTEMKEEILEIPTALARRLYNAFVEGFPDSGLRKLTTLAPLGIKTAPAGKDEKLLVDLVPIDPHTGHCERTGVSLRLESLTDVQIEQLREAMLKLASDRKDRFDEDSIQKTNQPQVDAAENLASFFRWLDRREGEPFTVIVDGANVGYYMQNFETGRFSYHQLQFVIDSLEELGERPLVVLPRKYTLDFFYVSVGPQSGNGTWKQRLTTSEKRIRTELMDSDKIAVVPSRLLDDHYWILASVSRQTNSRKGRDLAVAVDDESGRWPGTRPMLVTNDRMRDHRLGMLEPMVFQRWYSNYIVNYNFPPFVGGHCSDPEIGFSPADFFSREIQCNKADYESDVWHLPVSDQQDVFLCISIRVKDDE